MTFSGVAEATVDEDRFYTVVGTTRVTIQAASSTPTPSADAELRYPATVAPGEDGAR